MADQPGQASPRAGERGNGARPDSWLGRLREGGKGPQGRFNIWFWLIALGAFFILQTFLAGLETERLSYTEFLRLADEGRIKQVEISEHYIQGELLPESGAESSTAKRFSTMRVDPEVYEDLARRGIEVQGTIESNLIPTLLSWVIPIALFVGLWMFLSRRMAQSGLGGGLMQIGKSKAKIYVETDTGVAFDDVAGVDEAKDELIEVVEFLKDPEHYGRLGGRLPKGILLVGPPGTGKTLLARAVAGEAGVPFLSISGSEFVEMFVGVGAARVRDLFAQAREKAPAIIFIDELDALGRARAPGGAMGGHDEKEQTLNQLLVELDGFDTRDAGGLVLLGATNRPEVLDPALLRAGRFDRQVLVDRPDRGGRIAILRVHMRKIRFDKDADPEQVAALTPGFTGADLANLVNEAALLATRRNAKTVTLEDFSSAIERIVAGLEKRNRLINPRERRIVAYHEMGHALAAIVLPGVDPVHKVSIIPRGIGALGYTIQRPTEDRFLMSAEELTNKMVVLLGGRAAEHIVFGHISTGAADDLQKVTDIARSMVTRFGMSERLGPVAYERDRQQFLGTEQTTSRNHGDATQVAIDDEVRRLVEDAFEQSAALLQARREYLDRTAETLLERETLSEHEISELIEGMDRGVPEAAE